MTEKQVNEEVVKLDVMEAAKEVVKSDIRDTRIKVSNNLLPFHKQHVLNTRVVGPNQLCPCGSKIKYKKCCSYKGDL